MTKNSQIAVAQARKSVQSAQISALEKAKLDVALADVEVRAEQAHQQELANMIAMASNPSACPFSSKFVLEKIKELSRIVPG